MTASGIAASVLGVEAGLSADSVPAAAKPAAVSREPRLRLLDSFVLTWVIALTP